LDIDSIRIDGVEIAQVDAGGPGCNWGEQDREGWAHGWATVADAGASHGNVGRFNIYSGDAGDIVRIFHYTNPDRWIDVTQYPYLQFDWRATPGTSPNDLEVNVMLLGNQLADARLVWEADQAPPATWTHEVVALTGSAWVEFTQVFRIDFDLRDRLNATADPHLVGIEVDNICFTSTSAVPSPDNAAAAWTWYR
jgi:hypothetical protein